jgi:hypothetical protein
MMLGLTLHRPWDWAMAHGGKNIENRKQKPWAKVIGTRIALHAGKTYDYDGAEFIKRTLGITAIPPPEPRARSSRTTLIVGWVSKGTKANVKFASEVIASAPELLELASSEWFFGPYGWVMREPIALPKQVRARGMQGLWLLPDHVEAEVRRQEAARAA